MTGFQQQIGQVGKDREEGENSADRQSLPTRRRNLIKLYRSFRKKRRGASAVEFAVVAPVFFLLIFGMIEFGRMVMVQQVLTNASREGARLAVLDGTTSAAVEDVIRDNLANASVSGTGLSVTLDPSNPQTTQAGEAVTVTVSIPFDDVSWFPTPKFLDATTLNASTVMRREATQ